MDGYDYNKFLSRLLELLNNLKVKNYYNRFNYVTNDYLAAYNTEKLPQSSTDSRSERQNIDLKAPLEKCLSNRGISRILDIGCGNDTIIPVLIDAGVFERGINYYGFDYPDTLVKTFEVAVKHNIPHMVTLSAEIDKWASQICQPCIIIMRGQFHDKSIDAMAKILLNICNYIPGDSCLLIQDQSILPRAETQQTCWVGGHILTILEAEGFTGHCRNDLSITGSCSFTIHVKRTRDCRPTEDELKDMLVQSRIEQLRQLVIKFLEMDKRDPHEQEIPLLRINHDITTILYQLNNIKELRELKSLVFEYESLNNGNEFALLYKQAFDLVTPDYISNIANNFKYPEVVGFQNRGSLINDIDKFLRSQDKIFFIHGAPKIGKNYAIIHALSDKLKHERLPIIIDLSPKIGIMELVEIIAKQLYLTDKIDSVLLSSLKKISTDALKEVLSDLISRLTEKTILIIDKFENVLEPEGIDQDSQFNYKIVNKDIDWLLDIWSNGKNGKIIIESRIHQKKFPIREVRYADIKPFSWTRKGKYLFTIQLLNEFVPLKYRLDKFERTGGYPEDMLETISNHPYYASLASIMIKNNPDSKCLDDLYFIMNLKFGLYNDLISSFPLSETEREMIHVLPMLTQPFPLELVTMASKNEMITQNLVNKGFLVESFHGRYQPLGILKFHTKLDSNIEKKWNARFAEIFISLYNKFYDPIYYRQAFYHAALSKEKIEIILYNLPQVAECADSWYKSGNYDHALWAYNEISKQRDLWPAEKAVRASCLIRMGDEDNNLAEGELLFKELQENIGKELELKYLWIDSLLYLKKNKMRQSIDLVRKAINILESIKNKTDDYYWNWQIAKCYVQIPERQKFYEYYQKAANYYYCTDDSKTEDRLIKDSVKEIWPLFHEVILLARDFGDIEVEQAWLEMASSKFPSNFESLNIDWGSFYEKTKKLDKAENLLMEVRYSNQYNPYCILPLIRVLCKQKKFDKVEGILNIQYNTEILKEVVSYSWVYYFISIEDYFAAENKINQILDKRESSFDMDRANNIRWWLYVSLFLAWAKTLEGKKMKDKAIEGLKWNHSYIISDGGVPVLLKCLKLVKIAQDNTIEEKIIKRIHELNNTFQIRNEDN